MSPRFRIVVATYNRPDDLDLCLGALLRAIDGAQDCTLVIVNDASHSAAYDAVLRKHTGEYEYIVLPENLGPAGARKAGFADADEDYLICTDDDCIAPPFWLPWIRAYVAAYPEVDLIAGSTRSALTSGGSAWQRLLNIPTTYPRAHSTGYGLLTAVTACSVMRRDAYEAAGGFPDHLSGSAEDCYLTQEILNAGGSYVVPEDIETCHKANTSLRDMRRRFRWYGKGSAQTVYSQQNWKLAATASDGSLRDALRSAHARATSINKHLNAKTPDRSWLTRVTSWAVNWIISLEYEWGWYRAIRVHRRNGHGPLPEEPKGYAKF